MNSKMELSAESLETVSGGADNEQTYFDIFCHECGTRLECTVPLMDVKTRIDYYNYCKCYNCGAKHPIARPAATCSPD